MTEYRRERIPGYFGYWADTDGEIWCTLSANGIGAEVLPRLKTPTPKKSNGVLEVCLSLAGKRLYRRVGYLVLLTFVGGRPEGLEVCHRDDNQSNNHIDNVYWGTRLDNMNDRRRNGGIFAGEKHHFAKLTQTQVDEIKASTETNGALSARYGIHESTVSRIRNGKNWRTKYER